METVAVEGGATAIGGLFETVTKVITNILNLFGTVGETLLSNVIFQIVIGIIVLGIVMGLVFTMVRKLRSRGR